MNAILSDFLQIGATLLLLTIGAWAVARPIAALDVDTSSTSLLRRGERRLLALLGPAATKEMDAATYARAVIGLNLVGVVVVYGLQRLQHLLPLNPLQLPAVPAGVAFNTAVSFATNTNWQAYGGETTMSFFTQMAALTTQNFVSAATGIAIVFALARGFTRSSSMTIGNFWVDLVRGLVVLVPLSVVLSWLLIACGVPQTITGTATAKLIEGGEQLIALGPVATQVAIKQLGTNGGGFFNVNSAHPLENPTALSNLLQVVSILLLPMAMCFVWGRLVKDRGHGRALLLAMAVLFVPALIAVTIGEHHQPVLEAVGVVDNDSDNNNDNNNDSGAGSIDNMEGKEARFGVAQSALWAVATTAASNGSVNSMHDSYMPLSGGVVMLLMLLGEVVFGGVGSGLYGLMLFVIVAVFITGLMVGRTPELLGKKIQATEMKAASIAILAPSACVLIGVAIACLSAEGTSAIANPGAHGFSELLYAFASTANNNGSAFGGLTATGPLFVTAHAICMWIGRFAVIACVLALAGSLASKPAVPVSTATLPTRGALFVVVVAGTVILVGALTFIPALALGPIADHLGLDTAASSVATVPSVQP